MNIIRRILCLKIITIIALATFFISTMSISEAQAWNSAKCPCLFWGASLQSKAQARMSNASFEIDSCVDNSGSVQVYGESDTCTIQLNVFFGSSECWYRFICPADPTTPKDYVLFSKVTGLTEEEENACRHDIKSIAYWIFKTPFSSCPPPK